MPGDCVFCRIAAGELPADIVYASDRVIAFRDINPVAPVHVLVIPRQHIMGLATLVEEAAPLMGELFLVAR